MNGTIDLSAAGKARLVWEAARVPKCGPLDGKAAETLGEALEWAAQWRIIAGSTLPPRERERLKSIELAAGKLSCLLARYPATRGRIEQCWPDFPAASAPPGLRSTRRGLAALRKAAGRLQSHKGGARVRHICPMMTTTLEQNQALDEACRLVGRFLMHFAIMEQALDSAIGKLLGLHDPAIDIVSANIQFSKKIDVLFASEKFLAAIPAKERKTFLKDTGSGIMELNNNQSMKKQKPIINRVMAAHCPFEPSADGGVSFRRVVTSSGELDVRDFTYSLQEIERACERAVELAKDLNRVVAEMKPYEPRLDFSDPRNSGYLAILGL